MRWLIFLLIILVAPGCDLRKRERMLEQKEAELSQKEQQLLLKEKSLQVKEEQLISRELGMDSMSIKLLPDTLASKHPTIPGLYNVTMQCIETNCQGSAVGDTKTEQWQISFQNNRVIVGAMSDKKLVRSYSGQYIANVMELTTQPDSLNSSQAGEINVRLQQTRENQLEGQREIIRPDQCRILYKLELSKQ